MSLIPLDEVCHFDVVTSTPSTSAAVDADSTPTFAVFEEDTDTAILSAQNFTKRTSLTGNYRGSFTASAANGFEAGKWYNVIASATVGAVAGKCVALRFRVAPAESVAGVPKGDTSHFGGTAGTFAAGIPEVKVASIAAAAITATSIAADAITDAKVASDVTIASVTGAVGSVTGAVGSVTGNVGGNVVGSVASVTAGVTLAASAVQAIWDALTSALTTVGSIGKLLVDNINATISSRLASASYTAPLDAAGTRSAVGLASANLDTQLGTIDDFLDTEIAAIKAKTDNLPSDPADQSLIIAATDAIVAAIAALNNLSAAGVRTAIGLASANLDTQLDALPTNAELATALGTADDATLAAIAALSIPTAAQNAAALMDLSNGVETGLTPRQAMRLMVAALAGKLSGAATTTITIRNAVADSKDRIVATVTSDGDRTAITTDLT